MSSELENYRAISATKEKVIEHLQAENARLRKALAGLEKFFPEWIENTCCEGKCPCDGEKCEMGSAIAAAREAMK